MENINTKGQHLNYLFDYKDGKIKLGLGLDCILDNNLRYKPKQLNIILGHDNVGKTYFINWYFLTLALKHDLTFCIWSGENNYGQILRDFVQMYSGKKFKELSKEEIRRHSAYLEQYFDFVDNSKLYKPEELFETFRKSKANVCLIDPYTGLDRQMGYEGNYKFLNAARQFVNETEKTLYINTHPNTESGRLGNFYPKGHPYEEQLKPPLKDHIEGGKAFLNRCDDMFVIHRFLKMDSMKYTTLISVEKIKDTDTGGAISGHDEFIYCDFNRGLGFTIGGVDVLKNYRPNMLKNTNDKKMLISTNINDLPF